MAMHLKIGELAKLSGLGTGAIRYYEKEGLLGKPERNAGNYRLYDEDAIDRLRFIRHCRMQGLALEEIKLLLSYLNNPQGSCQAVHALVDKHMAQIDEQIAQLQLLREQLLEIRKAASCSGASSCNLLQLLMDSDDCPFCQELYKRKTAHEKKS